MHPLLNVFVNYNVITLHQVLRYQEWLVVLDTLSTIEDVESQLQDTDAAWKDDSLKDAHVCRNKTESTALILALSDPDVDIHASIEVALAARGVIAPDNSVPSSCPSLWSLVFLHWAERLSVAVLDSPLLAESQSRDMLLLRELRRLVRKAQQQYIATGGDLTVSLIAQLFRRLASRIRAYPRLLEGGRPRSFNATRKLLTLYCGRQDPKYLADAAKAFGWTLTIVHPSEAVADENLKEESDMTNELDLFTTCSQAYEAEVWKQVYNFDVVLLWNPLTFWQSPENQWQTFYNINLLAERMRKSGEFVIGFPSVSPAARSSGRHFIWPARRIRWRYWKLQYWEGSTGYTGVVDGCYRSDSTSATRLVSARTLRATRVARGSAWFSAIDLAVFARTGGRNVLTCPHVLNFEPDWLPYARLGKSFAQAHQIEAARWTPRVDPQVQCLVRSLAVAFRLVSLQGVVTPWCFRRSLHRAITTICDWWRGRSPLNLITPMVGSRLALIRGGRPMPWDTDADLMMISQDEFHFEQHANSIAGELRALGCTIGKCKDVVGEGFQYCSVYCVGVEGVQVLLDLFFQGGDAESEEFIRDWAQRNVVWQAPFAGSKVHIDAQLVMGMAFSKEYAPKLMRGSDGDLQPLHCLAPGHNACLPDCRDAQAVDSCELDEDGFVLLDVWMPVGAAA